MKTISSRQNPEIKAVTALSDSAERRLQGKFIAEGLRICTTLINSPITLVQLYCTDAHFDAIKGLVPEHKITMVNDEVMHKMSQAASPSGILGVFQTPSNPEPSELTPGMVLARIADPGNMGTLIRTCAALKLESIVIIEGVDCWSPKVIQSCAGTIGAVKIFRWSWEQLVAHKNNLELCALVVRDGKAPHELNLKNALLVVGNEADGIPAPWIAQCEMALTLPMPGGTESLNAAVAGSIAAYVAKMERATT